MMGSFPSAEVRAQPGRGSGLSAIVLAGSLGQHGGDRRPPRGTSRGPVAAGPRVHRRCSEAGHQRIDQQDKEEGRSIIRAVRTADDRLIGRLLNSADGKTTLVLIELTKGFLNRGNWRTLAEIETLIAQEGELVGEPDNLFAKKSIPPGLDLSLSGPAAVGRDLRRNSEHSTETIMQWTLLIVIAGLLLFYRAPLLALVPLVTVLAAVGLAMARWPIWRGWAGWGCLPGWKIMSSWCWSDWAWFPACCSSPARMKCGSKPPRSKKPPRNRSGGPVPRWRAGWRWPFWDWAC